MYKKTKGYAAGGPVKSKGMRNGGQMKSKGYKTGGRVQPSSRNTSEERIKNSIFDPKPAKGPKSKTPMPKRSKKKWFNKKTPNESKIRKGPGR